MNVDLKGKVAIITGGGGFIGAAICEDLARNGAIVVVQDVNEEKANAVVEKLKSRNYVAVPGVCSVSDAEKVEALVNDTVSRFGKIDILVNNAGTNTPMSMRTDISGFDIKEWERLKAIDLDGVFLFSKYVTKYMKQQISGRIINISSVGGVVALMDQCAFVAAKSGVLGLTRAMAVDLGKYNILVNAIAPGSMLNAIVPERKEAMISHVPLHRQGKPEEVAAAVTFLASPEASYITGAMLPVDGGWTCGFMRDW